MQAAGPGSPEQALRLHEAFDSTPMGLAYVSLCGRVLRANRRLCAVLGRDAAELETLHIKDLTHPEDLALDLEHAARLLAGEIDRYTLAKRYVRPDGGVVPARLTVALVRDAAASGAIGAPLHFVSIVEPLFAESADAKVLGVGGTSSRSVLEAMAEGFVVLDRDFRVTRINAEGLALHGQPEHEIVGRAHWEVLEGSGGNRVQAAYRRAMIDRVPVEFEHRYQSGLHDGWLELRAYPAGEGLAVFFRNITARKAAERRQAFVLALNERLRDLADPQALMDAATGALGEYLQVAQVGYGEVHQDQEHLSVHCDWNDGRVPSVVGTWRMNSFGPDFIRNMKAGQTVAIADVTRDARTNAPHVAAAYASIQTRSLLDVPLVKQGRMVAVMFIHHSEPRTWTPAEVEVVEQTCERLWAAVERADAARALADSEARFRLLADTMPQIVWATRADGYHDYFNERWYEYTGMPRPHEPGGEYDPTGTGQGWNWKDYLHPDDQPSVFAAWSHSLATGDPYHVEYRFRRHDGAWRWFIGRALALKDAGGRITRWFGTLTDNDDQMRVAQERNTLIEQLREADRRKDEFLAMLAHELRNPLAPLTNALRLLERSETLTERGRATLAMVERQRAQLARLVDDLLEVTRITRGLITLRPKPMSLSAVVLATVESLAATIERRGQRIRIVQPPEPVRIVADAGRITQVLENLIRNAIKYTPDDGMIRVELAPQADWVELRVVDNGVGIEPARVPEIFELFTQLDATLDRSQGGLGIGLALVKRLIELHGGSVAAYSGGLGTGATFTVRLPRHGEPP